MLKTTFLLGLSLLLLLLSSTTYRTTEKLEVAVYDKSVESLLINPEVNLKKAMDSLKRNNIKAGIYISKYHNRLGIMAHGNLIKSYPVVFGRNPVDDKLMQGDRCTPEGRFRVKAKYPHKDYNKFIWIDYPNAGSWKKHNYAKAQGTIPKGASIGGSIGLHGITPEDDWMIDQRVNWTYGCISMKNKHMDEIYPYVENGMPIMIVR